MCEQCGRKFNCRDADPAIIFECRECERPICSKCVVNYDFGGGYDGRQVTQWECGPCETLRKNLEANE